MKTRAGGWVMNSSPTLFHLATPANNEGDGQQLSPPHGLCHEPAQAEGISVHTRTSVCCLLFPFSLGSTV